MSRRSPLRSHRRGRKMYCGNNRLYHGLRNGTHTLGTRVSCLRRGYGAGRYTPLAGYEDVRDYTDDQYEPLDGMRAYCGRGDLVPPGYTHLGSLSACLRKGYYMGRRQRCLSN